MAPIYWLIGLIVVGAFFWRALSANRKRARTRLLAHSAAALSQENRRLRHVIAEMSLDNHALKYKLPDRW